VAEGGGGPAEVRDTTPILPAGRSRVFVAVALLAAFVIRAVLAIRIGDTYRPLTDAADFDRLATSLALGHGWPATAVPAAVGPTAFRAPLYPALLGVVYRVAGVHHYTAGLMANAVVGTIVVALIAVVATQLWGRRVGAVALCIAAVHPTLMLYGTSLQLEPLLEALLLAALAAALQHRRSLHELRWATAAGVCAGLAVLTREIGFALIIPVCWLVWTGRPRPSRTVAAPLVALVAAAVIVVPWTARNAVTLHAFEPVSTSLGVGLAGVFDATSFHNHANPALWIPPWTDPAMARIILAHPDPTEVHVDNELTRAAVDFLAAHPTYFGTVIFWNTIRLFDLNGTSGALFAARYVPYPRRLTEAGVYSSYLLDALALVGLALGVTRGVPRVIWLVPVLAWLAIVLLSGNIRYRASIEPFTVLLAAAGAVALTGRLRHESRLS
jgi:4-amino-4-deoxy-L-arabinose transferase-like glycosyltransferase